MKAMQFDEKEIKVASSLVKSSKSAKLLSEELGLEKEDVEKILVKFLQLGIARNMGGRYSLIAKVRRSLMGKEKIDIDRPFKVHAILEGQSENEQVLANANKVLIDNIKKDNIVKVSNLVEEDIIKEGETYYVMFELDVYAKNLEDLLYFVIRYGPSSIEFEKPDKFELDKVEAQGMLMDVATVLHSYMGTMKKLKEDNEIVIK